MILLFLNRKVVRLVARFHQISIEGVEVGGVTLPKEAIMLEKVERFLALIPADFKGRDVFSW